MNPDTAAMLAATMTAATFAATMPNAHQARREGWTPRELQRSALTAGAVATAGGAILSAASGAGGAIYVTVALSLGLALVYQLAAGAADGR